MHFFTEALAAATRRGVKLGNPNGANDLRACGVTSVQAVAEELNARGILTPRGGQWHLSPSTLHWLDRELISPLNTLCHRKTASCCRPRGHRSTRLPRRASGPRRRLYRGLACCRCGATRSSRIRSRPDGAYEAPQHPVHLRHGP